MKLKNLTLIEIFRKNPQETKHFNVELCFEFLKGKRVRYNSQEKEEIEQKLGNLFKIFKRYYKQCHKSWPRLEDSKLNWLNSKFDYDFKLKYTRKTASRLIGRPHVPYICKRIRSRQKDVATIVKKAEYSTELLLKAAERSGKSSGKLELARSIRNVANQHKLTPDEGLLMTIEADLSQRQYMKIKNLLKLRGNDVLPSLSEILKAKKKCRPSGLEVSNSVASIPLQNILDHTAQRIVKVEEEKIIQMMESSNLTELNLTGTSKWGCDGSSAYSQYNQDLNAGIDDSNLFAVTLTPLLMSSGNAKIWENKTPSSYRFCRVISIEFTKETKAVNVAKYKDIQDQIAQLNPTTIELSNGYTVRVNHELHMTQVDGKVVSHVTETSSFQRCSTCKAVPSQMNNLENLENGIFTPDLSTYRFGLSILHCWLRCLDCILHIGYNIDFQKWQARKDNKELQKLRKKEVQKSFERLFNVRIDQPLAGGSGNSNTGNAARQAFASPEDFSQATGVDLSFIQRLQTILIAISCFRKLDEMKFSTYCSETFKIYVDLYPWFNMPASLHRLLIHGPKIIASFDLPIGFFSEEGAEARNKYFRNDRLHHGRKDSRAHNIEDIINRANESSDPFISEINVEQRLKNRKKLPLPSEVINLLEDDFSNETEFTTSDLENIYAEIDL